VSAVIRQGGLDVRVRAGGWTRCPSPHDPDSLAGANTRHLSTRFGDLDIAFTPESPFGYDDLRRDAVEVELQGTARAARPPGAGTRPAR
jgi:hypothetical protein